MAAAGSTTVPGIDSSNPIANTSKLVPVSLDLDGKKAKFIDGKWVVEGVESKTDGASKEYVDRLMQRIRTLEDQGSEYERRLKELADANAMLAFKHKLMLEMLAVAQLDGETAARMLRDERLRTEALKWELARTALTDARVMAEGPGLVNTSTEADGAARTGNDVGKGVSGHRSGVYLNPPVDCQASRNSLPIRRDLRVARLLWGVSAVSVPTCLDQASSGSSGPAAEPTADGAANTDYSCRETSNWQVGSRTRAAESASF